jgi:hypothetical protein
MPFFALLALLPGACAATTPRAEGAPPPAAVVAQAAPANLPAQRFVAAPGQPGSWLYADPEVCHCVYAGDQAGYDRYHAAEYRADIADERQRARTPDPSAVAEFNNNNEGAAGSLGY